MTESLRPPTPESLLEHREWMRAIARSLVADENRVDDVEQRTWLVVLANRRPVHAVRAWLRRVVHSAAVDEYRSEERRRRREEASARPEGLPPTDHLVAQAEAHRIVAHAVTALPEPYRTTVLLRYFEGLSLDEVAGRMASPVRTVQTRLTRAHALLRDALDRDLGDRRRSAVLLLALAGRSPRAPVAQLTTRAVTMAGKVKLAVAVAILVSIVGGVWMARTPPTAPPATADARASGPASGPGIGGASRARVVTDTPVVQRTAPRQGRPVEVLVLDTSGQAIAAARLGVSSAVPAPTARAEEAGFLGIGAPDVGNPGPTFAATTRADGTARVDDVPAGNWLVRVDAEGHATHRESLVVQGRDVALRVVLQPAFALEGTVLRFDGTPAVDALVRVGTCRARTSSGGRYRVERLAQGNHDVVVDAAGVAQALGTVAIPAVEHLDLRLLGGCALRGRVVDEGTGAPVAGARVRFRGTNYGDLPQTISFASYADTDTDGRFGWDDLPAGVPAFLQAAHAGYARFDGNSGWQPVGSPLLPGAVVTWEVRLARGARVRGRVGDAEGNPLAGAVVDLTTRVDERSPLYRSAPSTTGADGTFEILASCGHGLVRVRLEGAVQRGLPADLWGALRNGTLPAECTVDIAADRDNVVDVVMDRAGGAPGGGVLVGSVSRKDGAAAVGVQVLLSNTSDRSVPPVVGTIDAHGAFRFDGLAAGTYALDASATACAPLRRDGIVVPADGAAETIDIALPPEMRIAGRVVDAAGTPVPGASVSLSSTMWDRPRPIVATTRADGSFEIVGLADGRCWLDARASGFVRHTVEVAAGTADVVVTLDRALAICGTTIDAATGRPLGGVPLHATFTPGRMDTNRNTIYRETVSDAEGRFVLGGLAPDTYDVHVGVMQQRFPWGAGDLVLTSVHDIRAGASGVRVPVTRGLAIAGRVVDGSGRAVPCGVVDALAPPSAREPQPAVVRRAAVAGDGTFRIPGLAPGTYDLAAGAQHAEPGPVLVRAVAAGATNVVVPVAEPVVISGRLVLESGTPFASRQGRLQLRVVGPGGERTSRATDCRWERDGTFRSGPLPPDAIYDIVFDANPDFVGGIVRGVRPGATDIAVVVVVGGTISGRVLDAAGNPVPRGVRVSAHAVDADGTGRLPPYPGDSAHTTVDADGRFVLHALRDAAYEISAGGAPSTYLRTRADQAVRPGASGVEIRLRRGATLSGRLVDTAGEAVRAGFVQVERHGSPFPLDDQGRFTIPALEPGRATVFALLGERVVRLGEVTIPDKGVEFVVPDP